MAVVGLTVKVATLDVVLPHCPVTTQRYLLLFRMAAPVTAYEAEAAPEMLAQVVPPSVLTCHW